MFNDQSRARALVASALVMTAIIASASVLACSDDDNNVVIRSLTSTTFVTTMNGGGENPPNNTPGVGTVAIVKSNGIYNVTITYSGMTGPLTGAHIHGPAPAGQNASIIVPFPTAVGMPASGTITTSFVSTNTAAISNDSLDVLMRTGNAYVNLHTAANPGGEIRGQLIRNP